MTVVVISQPMLFPWVGLFEQIQASEVFVHYVDAQFSKGSFTNRVQVKTSSGIKWLTVPLQNLKLGIEIREARVNYRQNWQRKHIEMLKQSYAKTKYCEDMIALVESVYCRLDKTICELAIRSMDLVCSYYSLKEDRKFVCSPDLKIEGSGSAKVLAIVQELMGTVYVTGHGARNYLEHETFEQAGVEVRYMNYRKTPYPQLHGPFTPYVTILDLIANVGPAGREYIGSPTVNWREFLK
jgi:hypothetical protein